MIIYKATNKLNGKIYIGQTISTLEIRIRGHFNSANRFVDKSIFGRALRKYGKDGFDWCVIDVAETEEELGDKEDYWIEKLQSRKRDIGYNIHKGGKAGSKRYPDWFTPEQLRERGLNPVYCHQTGIIYRSIKDTSKILRIAQSSIRLFLDGKISSISGYTFEEVHDSSKYPLPIRPFILEDIPLGKRKVYCHQNQKIYNNHKEAEKDLGIPENRIMDTLTDITKSHLFISRYSFEWFDESKSYPLPVRPMGKDRSVKKVFCKETGKIYANAREAEKDTKVKSNRISEVCTGKRPHACNLHFEFVLAS